ncbi:MAG: hypothetical protein HWN67_20390 [Candidatus Helarchaeota archaeon]|nr:hypothetical protein [Candidatus Helarchaeota archaeon]
MEQITVVNEITTNHAETKISDLPRKDTNIGAEKKIIFKEIYDDDELIEMFSLRCLVYQYVKYFFSSNGDQLTENQLDIDCFDLYSTFLGAFEITKNSKRLIGTVRIISGNEQSVSAPFIKSLYKTLPGHESDGKLERTTPFPHMETFNVPHRHYTAFFEDKNALSGNNSSIDDKPYEISRLAVLPEYWKTKDRVEMGLHDMIILSSWKAKPRRNIYMIATHPRTKRRYERIGFKIIPGTGEHLYKGINQPAILMIMNLEEYLNKPNPYSKRCKSAFPSFIENGYHSMG